MIVRKMYSVPKCLKIVLILSLIYIPDFSVSEMEAKVVGGDYASMEKVPHAARLTFHCRLYKRNETVVYGPCGSSILSQRLVITAAHCIEHCKPAPETFVGVSVGNESIHAEPTHFSEDFVIHENYDTTSVANDLALIKLKTPLRFGPRVQKIAIMSKLPEITTAYIAGWGVISENFGLIASTEYIKRAEQVLLDDSSKDCIAARPPPGTICATGNAYAENYGYSSGGDSGSGLIGNDYILIGIVSYKIRKHIIVYTNVTYHYNWIVTNARRLFCGNEIGKQEEKEEDTIKKKIFLNKKRTGQ